MIYVDHLTDCLSNARWPYRKVAHLFADTMQELHNFAAAIGLRREWFQPHIRLDHYDLTYGKWKQAQAAGAILLDRAQTVAHFKPPPKSACESCGASPLQDDTVILTRANPLGELPAVWRCQRCSRQLGAMQ